MTNNRPLRLLHTSDWHIGRQLHGVSLLEDQAHVLAQIIEIVEREAVDAIVIAGDIYDRAIPPTDAVTLLSSTLRRLCLELGRQVIVIAGNHDNGERLGFGSELLDAAGLHIIGPLKADIAPIELRLLGSQESESLTVDVFALPYAGPLTVRHVLGEEVASHEQAMSALLARVEQARNAQRPTVVTAHCFVDGGSECESERPLSVGGADRIAAELFLPYTYAALGHLHGRQYREAEHIRYSGSILKYSFSESAHRKSVTIVDIDARGGIALDQIELQARRDLRIVEGRLEQIIENGKTDSHREDYILARITNSESLLDAMGRLRAVYPNILQLQNIGLRDSAVPRISGREVLKRGTLRLFEEFFQEVQAEPLSEAQHAHMVEVLDTIEREDSV